MKILFVVESVSEESGANVNIACSIAKEMLKRNEVDVLSQYTKASKIASNIFESFSNVLTFYNALGERINRIRSESNWNEKGCLSKFCILLKNRILLGYFNYFYFNNRYLKNIYRKEIKKCQNKKEYDAIIVVCNPHYLADSLQNIKTSGVKGVYQLDPYSFHQMASNKTRVFRIIKEKRWIRKYDFYITTPVILEEFRKNKIKVDYSKIYDLDFPLICENKWVHPTTTNGNTIDCYFVGNFYPSIRSPHFLLKLFSALPSNFILHIVGKGAENEISNSLLFKEGRIVNHGWVSPLKAWDYISKSDILINLNNEVSNMLPSKTIEYICTGKPIINICKREDCLSIEYMKKYPNSIVIFENEMILERDKSSVIEFVTNCLGHSVPYEIIKDRFYANTLEYASKKIVDVIEKYTV